MELLIGNVSAVKPKQSSKGFFCMIVRVFRLIISRERGEMNCKSMNSYPSSNLGDGHVHIHKREEFAGVLRAEYTFHTTEPL